MFKKRKTVFFPLAVLAIGLIVCLLYGRLCFSKKPFFLFNYSFFIVGSSSMEPDYAVCSLVLIKKEPFGSLKTGEVIVYKSDALGGGLAFHRITRLSGDGLYTKGDMNDFEDNQLITEGSYVGKGIYQSYWLGRYLLAVKTPLGFILFFTIPCASVYLFYKVIRWLIKNRKNL